MSAPPIYGDALALASALFAELASVGVPAPRTLDERLTARAMGVLECVSLALATPDASVQREHLHDADEALEAFRALLSLVHNLAIFDDEAAMAFHEQADSIGRQLGGWLKRLRE